MAVSRYSLSRIVLRVAVALFLIVTGILTLQLDSGLLGRLQAGFAGNEVANAIHNLFKGDLANILIILMGVLQLVSGVFLFLGFFINLKRFNDTVLLIVMIMWLVVILLVDVMGRGGLLDGAFETMASFLTFAKVLSAHLLVLGAIMNARE